MPDLDSWQEIAAALGRNKLRALLTAFSVFWGVFMLVVMLGLGRGFERGTRKNLAGLTTRSLFVWSGRTSMPYQGLRPGRYFRFRNSDTDAIARIPGVEYVAPRIRLGNWRDQKVVHGSKAGSFTVTGDVPNVRWVEPFLLLRGRFFNDADLGEGRKIAVIGTEVQRILFGDEEPIGKHLQVRGVSFQIVGIIGSDKGGDEGDRVRGSVYLPFTTFQQAFNERDRVHWFTLTLLPATPSARIEAAIKRTLGARHRVHPEDLQAIGSFNAAEKFDQIASLFRGIELFVWLVGTLTLLAGVLGVSNILLVTVRERTREFGIRKAMGAPPRAILAMVFREAVALTSIAGYAGLIAGVGTLDLLTRALSGLKDAPLNRPEIDFGAALVATVILILSGALAGLLPARHAARINPVEALRAE